MTETDIDRFKLRNDFRQFKKAKPIINFMINIQMCGLVEKTDI